MTNLSNLIDYVERRERVVVQIDQFIMPASTKPSALGMKQSTPTLLITDGKLGHSDAPIDDEILLTPT